MIRKLAARLAASTALMTLSIGLSAGGAAMAQTEAAPAPAPAPAATAAEEELIVTGSRIRRDEFTSPSPVQVITSETSALEGLVDTGDILQQSSVASGSFQSNNLLSGYVISGGQNVKTVSLRGLGAERTLVLLNGRRISPAGQSGTVGAVDLNVIPSSIIDRTEILKDGASSIYGSDAVAGVVNIITKVDTNGLQLDLYANDPLNGGGGETYQAALSWGEVYTNGYLNFVLDVTEQDRQKRSDRDDTSCDEDYLFDPSTGERVDYTDPATGQYKCYDALNNSWQAGDVYGGVFVYDPDISDNNYPAAALGLRSVLPDYIRAARAGQPSTFSYAPYSNDLVDNADVISPITRTTAFIQGGIDLTDDVEFYTEMLFNRRESSQTSYQQLFEYVDPSNPNNTVAAGLQAAGASGFARPIIIVPSGADVTVDYTRLVGGLRGDLSNGWSWDLFAQYGDSDADYNTQFIYQDRVYATTGAALACDESPDGGNLSNFSCSALPNGVPWFSQRVLAGDLTDAEQSFLLGREAGTTKYTQMLVEGTIAGDILEAPAGKVGVALGFQARYDELDDSPGVNAQNGNYWGQSTAGRSVGDDSVWEVFGEARVPLLKSLPFVEKLSLEASARYTEYDSYGGDSTYKAGLNWQVTPEWRLRGTHGTSFRAPALYELYLADQTSFYSGSDPCTRWGESSNVRIRENCAAAGIPSDYGGYTSTPQVTSGGGAGRLKAETSEASTLGLIWTPSYFNFNLAVDYFEIEINDEVARFGAANILSSCYNSTNYPNDFCTLFTRDPVTNDILTIDNNYLNINTQLNRGIDLTTRYVHEFDIGTLTFETQLTWQLQDVIQLLGGVPDDNNGLTTEPDFTGVANLRFDRGDWTGFWSIDMYGKASDTEYFGGDVFYSNVYNQNVYYKQYTEFTAYHSGSVRKRFDGLTLQVGVQNVFDEPAPSQSTGQFRVGTAALNFYDLRGRRLFVDISKKW